MVSNLFSFFNFESSLKNIAPIGTIRAKKAEGSYHGTARGFFPLLVLWRNSCYAEKKSGQIKNHVGQFLWRRIHMGGSVIFYTYGSTLELNGQQLTAGMLTADLLNLSPDEYMRLKKRMTQITDLAEEYERKRDIALWWKLNEKMDALCQKLRRYQVFRLLLDEDEDAFFSAIREITEQFSVFPTEDQAPTAEVQKRQLERVANQFSQRDEYAPLDLFHPSEADLEDGMAFYYEMLRAFGPTKGAWRDYQKRLDRYALYLHDIRAFNETIQNFIRFGLTVFDKGIIINHNKNRANLH